jgi:hypothetical protein
MTSRVGRDDGSLKDLPAFRQVIGPGVRQCLEEGERHDQFADTADVLPVLAAMLGIARVRRVGDVQDRHAVACGMVSQQPDDFPGEGGVRGRQFEVLVVEQTQVDLCRREQGARGLFGARYDAGTGKTRRLDTPDAGFGIAIERVGVEPDGACNGKRQGQCRETCRLHGRGTSCIATLRFLLPPCAWSIRLR